MKTFFKILTLAAILQLTASCQNLQNLWNKAGSNQPLPALDYIETSGKMNIKNFLSGDLEGFAIVQNENGKIEKTFTTKVNGKWEENRGTVQFNFTLNGGKKDSHTWLMTVNEEGTFTVIGHDFSDPQAIGRQAGNTAQLLYTLTIPYKEKKQKINFEDNFHMVDANSAIVISIMKQGNEVVGKTILSLKKTN